MSRQRVYFPLQYRRARTLLYSVMIFWLWTWLGSAAFVSGFFDAPAHALAAMYAVVVAVLVSFPVALLAVVHMLLYRPGTPAHDVVVPLGARRAVVRRATSADDWWFSDRAP